MTYVKSAFSVAFVINALFLAVYAYSTRVCPSADGNYNYTAWQLFGDVCLKPVQDPLIATTLDEADEYCYKTYNGRLATIRDKHANKQYISMINQSGFPKRARSWIGAKYSSYDKNWTSSDYKEQVFFNWAPDSPVDGNKGNCISLDNESGAWFREPCFQDSDHYDFACEIDAPKVAYTCPDGWLKVGTVCLRGLMDENVEYQYAKFVCKEDYKASLFAVREMDGHNGVNHVCGQDKCWIGYRYSKSEQDFVSLSGQKMQTLGRTYWAPNEPVVRRNESNCVVQQDGKWYSEDCGKQANGFICQKPADKAKLACPSKRWFLAGDICIRIFHYPNYDRTYQAAREFCSRYDGLVEIKNSIQNNAILSRMGPVDSWIGVNDLKTVGDLRYDNGNELEYDNFGSNRPNGNCVLLDGPGGEWVTKSCSSVHSFICQAKSHPVAMMDERSC